MASSPRSGFPESTLLWICPKKSCPWKLLLINLHPHMFLTLKNNHTLNTFNSCHVLFTCVIRDMFTPRSAWWAFRMFVECFACRSPSCVRRLFRFLSLYNFRSFSHSFCMGHRVNSRIFTNKQRYLCVIMRTIPSRYGGEPIYCLRIGRHMPSS